jgi:hypothetical protein
MSPGESTNYAGLSFGPQTFRNVREVRAMPQQTTYSGWSMVPAPASFLPLAPNSASEENAGTAR